MANGAPVTMAMARGLDVLRAFDSDEEWLGNQDLAARTGLPAATVSRATSTLVHSGFLQSEPTTQKFRLGPAMLACAGRLTGFSRLRTVLRPIMRELADDAGASIGAAYLDGAEVVVFEYCRANGPVALSLGPGARAPMLGSASGGAIMSLATPAERALTLKKVGPDAAPRLRHQIATAEAEIGRDGYCRAFGSWHPEVNVIAAPWQVPASGMPIAITAAGPTYSMPADRMETQVAPRLLRALGHMRAQFQPTHTDDRAEEKPC